jgi:hypothetical protein
MAAEEELITQQQEQISLLERELGLQQEQLTQFVALVTYAHATTPTAQAGPGTKGRAKQSAARNVLDRLIGNREAVLAFLHRLVVSTYVQRK